MIFFHSGLKELAANGWPQAKAEKPAEKTTKKTTEKTAKKATEKDTEKGAEKVQPAPKASKIVQDGDLLPQKCVSEHNCEVPINSLEDFQV